MGRTLWNDSLCQSEGAWRRARAASRQHDQEGRGPDRRRRTIRSTAPATSR
jgi:hypothetical protein